MEIRELSLPDVYLVVPRTFADVRGHFYESFREDVLAEATGRRFAIAQTNYSVSRRGTLRGIHGVRTAPGQAKLVSCVRGAAIDVVVDLRVGSPTFGRHQELWLDERSRAGVFISEGLGHAFLALSDDTCMHYQCSTNYDAGSVVSVSALDPELALPWGLPAPPIMSDNDLAAPTLARAVAEGLLSSYDECRDHYAKNAL